MADPAAVRFKGRGFTVPEINIVREVIATCGGLSRQELAKTTCELLDWRRPNGSLKTWECREFLGQLESSALIALPKPRPGRPRGSRTLVPHTELGAIQPRITGTVDDVAPVELRRVATEEDRGVWRELVERFHYLGHRVPFGAHLRYLVQIARPTPTLVGCVQLSSPAWRIHVRDEWIGWTDSARRRNLQRVVNNSRFLILPWVGIENLASFVLSRMAREFPQDWLRAFGVRPALLETFVDARRHLGTCYRAANWLEVGQTTGRGRNDRDHRGPHVSPKRVLVLPLMRRARERLCTQV